MLNTDLHDLHTELALLREQVTSQLDAHRLEVAAAIEQLSGAPGTAVSGKESGALQARILRWERREIQLGERLAAKNIEYQALRARTELDRFRQQLQTADLEKELALQEAENRKLKSVLEALIAEHAECSRESPEAVPAATVPAATSPAATLEAALRVDEAFQELRGQLESSKLECAELRHAIETSLALKLARSIPRLLGPLRSLFTKRPHSSGESS